MDIQSKLGVVPGDCAKRLALETGEDFLTLPQADDEVEGSSVVEEESFSNSASGFEVYTTNYNREGQSVITQDQPGDFSAAKGAGGNTVSSTSPLVRRRIVLKALQISRARRLAKMEGSKPSQRTPEEVELALEVLNDELAGASPLDRPSLELATQALTDRLIELRKQQRGSRNPPEPTDVSRQSTHEYSSSLQAVIVGDGRQKYTLIKIPKQDDMHGDIYLVRGDPKAEYHYQTAIDTLNALQSRNILSGN
ncbi:14 kDa phosphohistidine phosphatase, putative [Eimeria praecox]|uniref:14 kDa phosphohistidine phosphatase, putative n=1 Tax=Eimeria praecox TaxID=51316 RepID=U6GNQ0_9EIME|nr:14 kDa phosphohistidine phosphatase, putative [Eimeria praecox]